MHGVSIDMCKARAKTAARRRSPTSYGFRRGCGGTRYFAVTRGLGAHRLAVQADRIDALNAEDGLPVLLKGVEVDFLEDGSLDLPDAVLGRLDLVVGAIHSHFNLPATKQTARTLRAIEHPHFSILAHPSGRLLGERGP